MNKLYKEYLAGLAKEVNSLYADFNTVKTETYVSEGGCTDTYEMVVDQEYQCLIDNCLPLFQTAINRGCSVRDLELIFPYEVTSLI